MSADADEVSWRAAGLLASGGAGRPALLAWLAEQGCSLEEMVAAEAQGRLFALAGDRVIRPPLPRSTVAEAAQALSAEPAQVRRTWTWLGLPDPEGAGLDAEDLEALATALHVVRMLGPVAGPALVRVLGAGLARLVDAESTAMRAAEGIDLGRTGDELLTAQAWQAVAELVPRVGRLLDVAHRRHIDAARRHWEDVLVDGSVRSGVGFADLTGFTSLVQGSSLESVAALLAAFDETAADVVRTGGGRVVKFLGDAVMWVTPDPDALVAIAHALVDHPRAREAGLTLRAAVAAGELVAQEGDWYGPPVNLAARLLAVARPGQLLAAHDPAHRLSPAWSATALAPVALRGIAQDVVAYDVVPAQFRSVG